MKNMLGCILVLSPTSIKEDSFLHWLHGWRSFPNAVFFISTMKISDLSPMVMAHYYGLRDDLDNLVLDFSSSDSKIIENQTKLLASKIQV